MLCKEEVCQWFRNLSGPKRLDLMSGLLQMCLPLEIRFLGSCVEDLAKRNYHFLRESEIKANDLNEIQSLGNMRDDLTRCKLNVYLALLHSTNAVCSNALYNTLTCLEPLHESLMNLPNSYKIHIAEEVLLLYTMAAHHPAFTFSQRQVLFEKLQLVQQMLESDKDETSDSASSTNCNVGNIVSTTTTNKQHRPNPAKKVYVKNIEVKGSQGTPDRRREFHLQVKWSDGEVTETYKTYQALHTFHSELIKLFPKDSGAHKQHRQIPFFPPEKGPGQSIHSPKDLADLIRKYAKQLVALPEHIVQCSHITRFLQNKPSEKDKPPLTVKGVDSEQVSTSVHKGSVTFYNSNITESRRASSDHHKSPVRPHVPTASSVTSHSNQRHVYSNTGSTPSPFSSPMQSPLSSPHISPSTSHYSSRSVSPWSANGKFDVLVWLKEARLHKYHESLGSYTPEQLVKLNDNDLDSMGLTQGARNKFHKLINEIKNGVITSGSSIGSQTTSPGSPWHSPPHTSVHLSPPVSQFPVATVSTHNQHNVVSNSQPQHQNSPIIVPNNAIVQIGREISPHYLENTSPPTSPVIRNPTLQHTDCPLMDDVDRESDRVEEEEEEKQSFQNNIPQGAIVESRPLISAAYPKHDGNHNNNAFMPTCGLDVKTPHLIDGTPIPCPQGTPRHIMQMDPSQIPMFFMHRPNIRSQPPPIKPPIGTTTVMRSPKPPNMNGGSHVIYENATLLQVTKGSVHDQMPSTTGAISVSMNAFTAVDTLPTYNNHTPVLGYSVPPAVVSNQSGNSAVCVSRPVTLALPMSTSINNMTLTYSVAPITTISTVTSVDIVKCNVGTAPPPPLRPIAPTSAVDSSYIGYHSVQSGSTNFPTSFQNQGGPLPNTAVHNPVQTPTHTATTPMQTPVTGVPQIQQAPTHVTSPPAPPMAGQTKHHSAPSVPSCSTCGCNGHCTTVPSASNSGYHQVMWHQPPMFPAGYPLGILPVTSNGLVQPNLPYSHPLPAMNLPNGLTPDVVYNNQPPHFSLLQQSDNSSNNMYVTSANSEVYSTVPSPHLVPRNSASTDKIFNCYNCGEAGHRAIDCLEQTMESLTHNGYHLNISARSDSE